MRANPSDDVLVNPASGESTERWGSWEDAELWRKQSFMRRTPKQRLQWLEQIMTLSRIAKLATVIADPGVLHADSRKA